MSVDRPRTVHLPLSEWNNLADGLADPAQTKQLEGVEARVERDLMLVRVLRDVLGGLNQEEQALIAGRLGLGRKDPLSFKALGEELHIPRSTAYDRYQRARAKLRARPT